MSLDLYQDELRDSLGALRPTATPELGTFDGFFRGAGMGAMKVFAEGGRAASMAFAAPLLATERVTGGTELQDRYFKWHDEVFGNAVDAWTARPDEVGTAGQVVGQLLGTLPFVIASPAAAVAMTEMSTAEDLVRKGVRPGKAIATGAVQGAGLGLGIWMPILGQNLWQRAILGGAGFNTLQGIAARGISGAILEGTPAAEEFKAFDGKALTLDVLLGLAFGSLAHLSPAQRAQGAETWTRIRSWAEGLDPSQVDAVAVLRQAEHKNVDSFPGKASEPAQVQAHTARVDRALEQLARDEPVEVADRQAAAGEPDPARWKAAERRAEQLKKEGEALAKAYDLVLAEPRGPVNEPLVRLMPEEIGDVLVERGMGRVLEKDGEIEIKKARFGLLKIIWKHGERSNEPEGLRVQREDVLRTPEVLRDYLPIVEATQPDGKRLFEWQVERADGQRVVYSVRRFSDGDGQQHLVTVFVNKLDQPHFRAKPISEMRNRQPESPTVGSMPSVRDTGPQPLLSSAGGQEGGSDATLQTKGPAGQPRGGEPPPPRAASGEKPAGLAELEAERLVAEGPDRLITVGADADGKPITRTAKEYLEGERAAAAQMREQVKLLQIAAQCLLGRS